MFIGHFGIGFAAKRAAPRASLGLLFLAVLWADMLLPIFLLTGWEQGSIDGIGYMPVHFNFPFSHGLAELLIWATLIAGTYFGFTRYRRGAIVIGLCVVSHWLLDWITHRTGIVFYSGSKSYGLGLWNHPLACGVLESVLFLGGLWLYLRTTRATDRTGYRALLILCLLLGISYAVTFVAPPPSSVRMIAVFNLSVWLFPLWGAWIDRHRTVPVSLQV